MPAHHAVINAGQDAFVLVSASKHRRADSPHTTHHAHVHLGDVLISNGPDCPPGELARILRKAADRITKDYDELNGVAPASNVAWIMQDLDDVDQAVREHASSDRDRIVANRTLTSLRAEAIDGNNNNPRDAA
jgi:hypothetical protein